MAGLNDPVTAVILSLTDDVGTLLEGASKGQTIILRTSASGEIVGEVIARQDILFGHKVARWPKQAGDEVCKYGRPIGLAKIDISKGDHVHTHNLSSLLVQRRRTSDDQSVIRPAEWVRNTVTSCLLSVGVSTNAAEDMADAITEAHLRGVETHGIRRMRPYVQRIRLHAVDPAGTPLIERRKSIINVDGQNAIGHHVGSTAARAVSEAASEHGIGIALIRNSNHFGFAGYYATAIAAHNQIGMVISNGQVCVAPPGGLRSIFSNNPIAISAPLETDEYFEMDIATSVTSRAKIAQASETGELIPLGLALDIDGESTDDPKAALTGSLLPMGGLKGFFLLFALEVLTGVFTGGAYADMVSSKEAAPQTPENVSHLMLALDLKKTVGIDLFKARLKDLIHRVETLPLKSGLSPLHYPGWDRWKKRRERLTEGIPLSLIDFEDLVKLAKELGAWTQSDA